MKTSWKTRIAALFTAFAAAACGTPAATPPAPTFDLQGHRGARGLAPENTLAAFDRALALGVTTLELDVGLSADGVPVVGHDPLLNPAIARHRAGADAGRWLTGARPRLRDATMAELQARWDVGRIDPASAYARTFAQQQAVDGATMPALADVFALAARRGASGMRFNIEPKTNPTRPQDTADPADFLPPVLAAIRTAGVAGRSSLQSFDWRVLRLAATLAPEIPRVHLSAAASLADPAWTDGLRRADFASTPALVRAAGGSTWSPAFGDLSAEQVAEARRLGLRVVPWTVNEPADIDRLLGWGVDGLISDYPDRVRAAMGARGMPLPAPAPPP